MILQHFSLLSTSMYKAVPDSLVNERLYFFLSLFRPLFYTGPLMLSFLSVPVYGVMSSSRSRFLA